MSFKLTMSPDEELKLLKKLLKGLAPASTGNTTVQLFQAINWTATEVEETLARLEQGVSLCAGVDMTAINADLHSIEALLTWIIRDAVKNFKAKKGYDMRASAKKLVGVHSGLDTCNAKLFLLLCMNIILCDRCPAMVYAERIELDVFQAHVGAEAPFDDLNHADWATALAFRNNLAVSLLIVDHHTNKGILRLCAAVLTGIYTGFVGGDEHKAKLPKQLDAIYDAMVPAEVSSSKHLTIPPDCPFVLHTAGEDAKEAKAAHSSSHA